jgi:hypothetical protein
MICRDQPDALRALPDLDGETVNIPSGFDQSSIIILAFNDLRRSSYPAILVQSVETIRDHEAAVLVDAPGILRMARTSSLTFVK